MFNVYKLEMADIAEPLLVKSCDTREEAEDVKKKILKDYWYYMVFIMEQ